MPSKKATVLVEKRPVGRPPHPGKWVGVSFKLDSTLLRALDKRARELDRSRSWCIADAIKKSFEEEQS